METRRLYLKIDSDLRCVSLVGVSIRAICLQEGLSEKDASEIELCVVEGTNNVIEHSYESKAGEEIALTLELSERDITIKISDRGKSMPEGLLQHLPQQLDFNPDHLDSVPEGGMGLILIKSMMNQVRYITQSGQNTLIMNRRTRE
jgi:serine/threonine-protein kinase RsbW